MDWGRESGLLVMLMRVKGNGWLVIEGHWCRGQQEEGGQMAVKGNGCTVSLYVVVKAFLIWLMSVG